MSENAAAKTVEAPAKTVEETAKRKNVQVATTISAEQYDGLVDRKWTARIEVKDQVKEALEDYFTKHGVKIDGSAQKHETYKK